MWTHMHSGNINEPELKNQQINGLKINHPQFCYFDVNEMDFEINEEKKTWKI